MDTKKAPNDDAMDALAYSVALGGADFDGDVVAIFDEEIAKRLGKYNK